MFYTLPIVNSIFPALTQRAITFRPFGAILPIAYSFQHLHSSFLFLAKALRR